MENLNGLYRGGYYVAYRYGDQSAAWRPGTPRRPAMNKDKLASTLARVTAILKDWKTSPFEREADCRHGLRQGLCLDGREWDAADEAAAFVVAKALGSLGARRPTFEEGQRHFTIGSDYCSWCRSPIDTIGQARGAHFCSKECAKASMANRAYDSRQTDGGAIRMAAYRTVKKAEAKAKVCVQCGDHFQSAFATTRYCSTRCSRLAHVAALPDQTCPECGAGFHPKSTNDVYCGRTCNNKVKNRKAARNKPLTPGRFDYMLSHARPAPLSPWRFDRMLIPA